MTPATPQHRVQRLLIELVAAPHAQSPALQAAAQQQLQRRLLPVLDKLCASLGDATQVQRIDRLEIQLGAWPATAWGDDGAAAAALQVHFEATLAQCLGQALQTASTVQADAELVASCLHTGQLPWWADASDRHALQNALAALLAQPLQPGLAWLPPADADAPALQRLVAALSDAQLADLAGRLQSAPTPGLPWPDLLGRVAATLALAPAHLRRTWWAEVLAAVLQSGGQGWSLALQRLPARLRWAAAPLAAAWRRALDHCAGQADAAALAPLWQALDQAWPALPAAAPTSPAAVPAPVADDSALDAQAQADARLTRLLQQLLQQLSTLRLSALPQQADAARWLPWAQALADALDAASLARRQRLAAALAQPGGPAPLATLAAQLRDWLAATPQAADRDSGQRPAAAQALAGLLATLSARLPAPPPSSPGQAQATRPAAPPAPRPAPLAAVEALYLANAGLVLLWPFLQRFAQRLGLLDQRQFCSPAHAQRAAVLLQCIATGDADPPEFQLPLCKLLCGLPLDAPLWLDAPLSADEQAECEDLLLAVVAAAPVLRQMSPAGLRSAFLQRQGQLSTQDGHWLLRVERQTHDAVMDRFPWSPALVRLPWMAGLLQVQW